MAEDTKKGIEIEVGATEPEPLDDLDLDDESPADWSAWRNLWQVPAIILSVSLIIAGLVVANRRAPENDFSGVLHKIGELVGVGEYETAKEELERLIEPNIALMTPTQLGLYHATLADWVSMSQLAAGVSVEENNQLIDEQYAKAVELNHALSSAQIERWAFAQIALGRFDEAETRLADLEAFAMMDAFAAQARIRRNRVLRRFVEASLLAEALPYDQVMTALERFRQDPILSPSDRAWVVAQQSRLRIEAGNTAEAVDRLLVEMRRFESESLPAKPWGELYALLGQAYYEQGSYDHAEYHLQESRRRLEGSEPVYGETLLLSGLIAKARGDLDTAREHLEIVVRDFDDTSAFLAGRVSMAEIQSIEGLHDEALEHFQAVASASATRGPVRGLDRSDLAAILADRHDAAIMMGDLPRALEYVSVAEGLFERGQAPVDVLFRMASTTRQIADNLMEQARRETDLPAPKLADLDPKLRHDASMRYERAAEYYLQHARALVGVNGAEVKWADSLWLTADSYDLAGLRRQAITFFIEYIAGRPIDDPRRAEATFRLAQAHESEGDFSTAAERYQQILDEHPRSPFGTASHVPLARCLVALERDRDAEQHLEQVVDGRQGEDQLITPDAMDYRDALVELGRLYYESGDINGAIERLTAAVDRYPTDPRIETIRFRLADSHQRRAKQLRATLEAETRIAPAEAQRRQMQTREAFEEALSLFNRVYTAYDQRPRASLDRLERELQRYAAMYRADCAFELEQYELAEKLYDEAARRYSDHHASMHALVQIVNCFERLGDRRSADIAHRNAVLRLKQLPDEAFGDPEALMDRAAWERWLMNRPLGLAQSEAPTQPN